MNSTSQKLIHQIVDENYIHASVLYFFGISFYNYSDKTLAQVCLEKGLNVNAVLKKLEAINEGKPEENIELHKYPIDLIIEYLKHNHHKFVKHKLPYISRLILNLDNTRIDKSVKDLKFIFPFFVEDFIKHIYDEEDTLFKYILTLYNAFSIKNKLNVSSLYYAMEKHSIREYSLQHSNDDHEMKGLRKMTNNYILNDPSDLHLKVIYAELNSFEIELSRHAQIENEILFPKALRLENEVSLKCKKIISCN